MKSKLSLLAAVVVLLVVGLILGIVYLGSGEESVITENQLEAGSEILLEEGHSVKFMVDEEEHSIEVVSMTSSSVVLTLRSEAVTFTLMVGSEKEFDLDDDGVLDVRVKLEEFRNGVPVLNVKRMRREVQNHNAGQGTGNGVDNRGVTGGGDQNAVTEQTCAEKGGTYCGYADGCSNDVEVLDASDVVSGQSKCCLGACVKASAACKESDCPDNMKCGTTSAGNSGCVFKTCSDIGGSVCGGSETCNGEVKHADLVGDGSYSLGCCVGTCEGEETPEPKPCVETDGGINIYVQGNISGSFINSLGELRDIDYHDVCSVYGGEAQRCSSSTEGGCKVYEYYCMNGLVDSALSNCVNGCEDGACLP